MVSSIQEARKICNERFTRRSLYEEQKEQFENEQETLKKRLENVQKARTVIQAVATATQKKIEFNISNLVTMALAAVFPDPYEFYLRFVERRNTSEADLIFSKNGNEINDILESGGGGVADIANFALIISLWALKKTQPIFIMDEPDKFIHNPQYQERTSAMMKELCDKLGIQIIIVSDQPNIMASADKIIKVKIKNGESYTVEELNGE